MFAWARHLEGLRAAEHERFREQLLLLYKFELVLPRIPRVAVPARVATLRRLYVCRRALGAHWHRVIRGRVDAIEVVILAIVDLEIVALGAIYVARLVVLLLRTSYLVLLLVGVFTISQSRAIFVVLLGHWTLGGARGEEKRTCLFRLLDNWFQNLTTFSGRGLRCRLLHQEFTRFLRGECLLFRQ